jgi:hypothetical protein
MSAGKGGSPTAVKPTEVAHGLAARHSEIERFEIDAIARCEAGAFTDVSHGCGEGNERAVGTVFEEDP